MYKKFLLTLIFTTIFTNIAFANNLNDIQKQGFINVGVKYDYEPFGYINEYGEVIGFDIDLAKYIANDLDVSLNIQQVTSTNRIDMLENNSIDLIVASMTHKKDRDKRIDFSISYFFDGLAILTSKYIKVNHHFGFNGKKVAVVKGSSAAKTFRYKVPKAKIIVFDNYDEALDSLYSGKIDAITTDMVWCVTQAKKSNGKLRVLPKKLTIEPYGVGVQENESDLLDAVNFSIQKAVKDGTYTILYNKWFHHAPEKLPEVW